MDCREKTLPFWKEQLLVISRWYEKFEQESSEFSKEAGIRCPDGCGLCCIASYEPEVTLPEGLYAAWYILEQRRELEKRFSLLEGRSCCIFYDEHTPFHCTIYPARPLICRGFGFSGYTDKHGEFSYRPCRHMRSEEISREAKSGPVLSSFQAQVSFGSAYYPISDAIFHGWEKLLYLQEINGPGDQAS